MSSLYIGNEFKIEMVLTTGTVLKLEVLPNFHISIFPVIVCTGSRSIDQTGDSVIISSASAGTVTSWSDQMEDGSMIPSASSDTGSLSTDQMKEGTSMSSVSVNI